MAQEPETAVKRAASAALGLALAIGLACGGAGCREPPGPGEEELRAEWSRLSAERERLQPELSARAQAILEEPEHVREDIEVVVAVPNRFVKEALSRTLAEALNGVSLRIKNLEVHVVEDVNVRILVPDVTLGTIALDVLLQDVRGVVRTREPAISIGEGEIRGSVWVDVLEGRGRVHLRLHWTGQALTRLVCGDTTLAREVEGTLAPFAVHLRGGAIPRVEGSEFVLKPVVPPTYFRLVIRPSRESWESVEKALDAQSNVCRFALRKIDALGKLRELLERGIQVTVHTEKLRPLRLPVDVSERVLLQDRELEVRASPASLEIRRRYVWFGSDFEVWRVPPSNP
jgi:hypothetical protein